MQTAVIFRNYMGSGLILGWYLISLIYLLLKEQRKQIRILFVYAPAILLLIFFNPLFARALVGFEDVYWRLLWLLPVTMTVAYAAVLLYGKLKDRARVALAGMLAVLVALSGNFVYADLGYMRAENLYHVPQAVADLCDAIEIEGREVKALFPDEMLVYVRQYSPVVCMPYGREVFYESDELHDVVLEEVIDVQKLADLAKARACHYVIFPKGRQMKGSLLDYDYTLFGVVDGYEIYRDDTMDFSVPNRIGSESYSSSSEKSWS